jgi:alpha-tubulin suppressor-like RCC1 family protein
MILIIMNVIIENGTVFSLGDSSWSQTGTGKNSENYVYPPCMIDQKYFDYDPIERISSGYGHSAFMTNKKQVYTCGGMYYCISNNNS